MSLCKTGRSVVLRFEFVTVDFTSYQLAFSRLPGSKDREKNACESLSGGLGRGAGGAQAPNRFSHAVVFVFPTIWEPGTGYLSSCGTVRQPELDFRFRHRYVRAELTLVRVHIELVTWSSYNPLSIFLLSALRASYGKLRATNIDADRISTVI